MKYTPVTMMCPILQCKDVIVTVDFYECLLGFSTDIPVRNAGGDLIKLFIENGSVMMLLHRTPVMQNRSLPSLNSSFEEMHQASELMLSVADIGKAIQLFFEKDYWHVTNVDAVDTRMITSDPDGRLLVIKGY